jgi:uncharacterized protein DUF4411
MSYVFDCSPLSVLFRNYYPKTFRSLWERFDKLVADGEIISTREVAREIADGGPESLRQWAKQYSHIFVTPTAAEGEFVTRIFSVAHFRQNIEAQKLLKGGRNADPFVIAKAAIDEGIVVTMEQFKPKGAKIPNICDHFKVEWRNLEQFMEEQGWEF